MSSDLPLEIASTLQTASIQARPDPRHDLNPSTAASKREPVTIAAFIATPSSPSSRHHQPHPTTTTTSSSWNFNDDDDDDDGIDYDDDDDNNNNNNNNRKTTAGAGRPSDPSGMIPISAIQPVGRRKTMPPLPDLRFEQNYLKSIEAVASWRGVAWVTVRDQLFLPLLQGALWTLAVAGWRHWNRAAQFQGQAVGARIRRWWWGVNKWNIP